VAVIAGSLAAPARVDSSPDAILSKSALLSPQVAAHEVISWRGIHTRYELNGTTSVDTTTEHTTINCGVIGRSADEIGLRGDVWAAQGVSKPRLARRLPDYAISDGRVTADVGAPVAADPICMFYSSTMYGSPPERLSVGTTWRFSNASSVLDAWVPNGHGIVTVTGVDVAAHQVTLRVQMAGSGAVTVRNFNATSPPTVQIPVTRSILIGMVVARGGVIVKWDERSVNGTSDLQTSIDHPNEIAHYALSADSKAARPRT